MIKKIDIEKLKNLDLQKIKELDIKKIKNTRIMFFIFFNILGIMFLFSSFETTLKLLEITDKLEKDNQKVIKNIENIEKINNLKIKELLEKSSYYLDENAINDYERRLRVLSVGNVIKVDIEKIKVSEKYSNVVDIVLNIKKKNDFIFNEELLTDIVYKKLKSGYLDFDKRKNLITKKGNKIEIKIISLEKIEKSKVEQKILKKINNFK